MDTQKILSFLSDITVNNNRPWFQEHKAEYLAAKEDFEAGIAQAITRIAAFDPSIAHITVRDTVYRFYRDTRFSPDKSPYKRHLGAYICAHGKKSLHGGYYIHLEPGNCMLACGEYYLPTNILTACRNEIMANEEEWLKCVNNKKFLKYFGRPSGNDFGHPSGDAENGTHGFGLSMLKTCPAGFPKDYVHIEYLRMKDYCCWTNVPDDFFEGDQWLEPMAEIFSTARPMLDFTNRVIDDYE